MSYDSGGAKTFYTHDANFNVTAAINASGTVVERYQYSPYGEATILDADFALDSATDDGLSDIGNEFLYTGRRLDPETGLYQFRNRYYHAQLGRFVNRDPIGYVGGTNLYNYVRNRPTQFVDPFGQCEYLGDDSDGNRIFRDCKIPRRCFTRDRTGSKEYVPCSLAGEGELNIIVYDPQDLGDGDGNAYGDYPGFFDWNPADNADGWDLDRTVRGLQKRDPDLLDLDQRGDPFAADKYKPGSCIKNLILHDHGATSGVMQWYKNGNEWNLGIPGATVDEMCKRLCDDATVYLLGCYTGRNNGPKDSTAEFILKRCKKVSKAIGCDDLTYTGSSPRCGGNLIQITPGGSTNLGHGDWTAVLPK